MNTEKTGIDPNSTFDANWALGLKGTTTPGYTITTSTSDNVEIDVENYVFHELIELYKIAKGKGEINLAFAILTEIKNYEYR